ncbi:hypothetical protein [Candidatus Poriferisodalis sp.]
MQWPDDALRLMSVEIYDVPVHGASGESTKTDRSGTNHFPGWATLEALG